MRLQKVGVPIVVGVLALGIAACGSSDSGGSGTSASGGSTDPIPIALEAPFTGDYASFGESYERGINTWKAQNGAPKVGRRPVEITKVDDACDVKTGVSAFRKQAPNIIGMIGPACSAVVAAVKPQLAATQIPSLFLTQADSITAGQKDGWMFRVPQPTTAMEWEFAQYLLKQWAARGIKSIAVMHDTSVIYQNAEELWTKAAEPFGIKVVTAPSFDLGATDFTAEVLKVKQSGADAVVVQTYAPEMIAIFKGLAQAGVKLPIAANSDAAFQSTIDAAGAAGEGVYFFTDFVAGSDLPGPAEFEKTFEQKYPDKVPDDLDYHGWLAMKFLMAALAQPGATEGKQKLREAIANVRVDLGDGLAETFDPSGDQTTAVTFVGQVRDGKAVSLRVLQTPIASLPIHKLVKGE